MIARRALRAAGRWASAWAACAVLMLAPLARAQPRDTLPAAPAPPDRTLDAPAPLQGALPVDRPGPTSPAGTPHEWRAGQTRLVWTIPPRALAGERVDLIIALHPPGGDAQWIFTAAPALAGGPRGEHAEHLPAVVGLEAPAPAPMQPRAWADTPEHIMLLRDAVLDAARLFPVRAIILLAPGETGALASSALSAFPRLAEGLILSGGSLSDSAVSELASAGEGLGLRGIPIVMLASFGRDDPGAREAWEALAGTAHPGAVRLPAHWPDRADDLSASLVHASAFCVGMRSRSSADVLHAARVLLELPEGSTSALPGARSCPGAAYRVLGRLIAPPATPTSNDSTTSEPAAPAPVGGRSRELPMAPVPNVSDADRAEAERLRAAIERLGLQHAGVLRKQVPGDPVLRLHAGLVAELLRGVPAAWLAAADVAGEESDFIFSPAAVDDQAFPRVLERFLATSARPPQSLGPAHAASPADSKRIGLAAPAPAEARPLVTRWGQTLRQASLGWIVGLALGIAGTLLLQRADR